MEAYNIYKSINIYSKYNINYYKLFIIKYFFRRKQRRYYRNDTGLFRY